MKISPTIFRKLRHNNAHVSDYLDAYRRMGNVDLAVMITGPWGSGKTEFVKSQYSGVFDGKPYFVTAHDIVKTAVQEVSSKRRTSEIHEMQDEFGKYPGRFYSALQDPSSHFCREPVFDRVDVDVFYRAYSTLSNVDKNNVGRILYARVGRGAFEVEGDFWRQLILRLKTDVDSNAGAAMSPSVFQKRILAEQLANVINYTGEVGQGMARRVD